MCLELCGWEMQEACSPCNATHSSCQCYSSRSCSSCTCASHCTCPRAESKATVPASAPVPRALESDVPVPVPAPVSNDPAPVLACRVPVTPVTSSRERQVARAINLLSPSKAFTQIRKTKGKKASQKDKKRKRDELKALRDEQEKRGERVTAAQLCEDIETVYNLEEAPPTSITVQRQDTRLIFVELSDWILTKLAGML